MALPDFKIFIIKITNSIEEAIIFQREKRLTSVPNKFREPTNTEAEILSEVKLTQNRKRRLEKKIQHSDKQNAMVRNVAYLANTLFNVSDKQQISAASSKENLTDNYQLASVPSFEERESTSKTALTVSKSRHQSVSPSTSDDDYQRASVSSFEEQESMTKSYQSFSLSTSDNVYQRSCVSSFEERESTSKTALTVSKSRHQSVSTSTSDDDYQRVSSFEERKSTYKEPSTVSNDEHVDEHPIKLHTLSKMLSDQTEKPIVSGSNENIQLPTTQIFIPLASVPSPELTTTDVLSTGSTNIKQHKAIAPIHMDDELPINVKITTTQQKSKAFNTVDSEVPTARLPAKIVKKQVSAIDRDTYMFGNPATYFDRTQINIQEDPSMISPLNQHLKCGDSAEKEKESPVFMISHTRRKSSQEEHEDTHALNSVKNTPLASCPVNTINYENSKDNILAIDHEDSLMTLDLDEILGVLDKEMYLIPSGQSLAEITDTINKEMKTLQSNAPILLGPVKTNDNETFTSTIFSTETPTTSTTDQITEDFINDVNREVPSILFVENASDYHNAAENVIHVCNVGCASLKELEKVQLENTVLRKEVLDLTQRNIALQHALVLVTNEVPKVAPVPPVPFEEKDGGRLYNKSIFLNSTQCEILDQTEDSQQYLNNLALALYGRETLKNSSVTGAGSKKYHTPGKTALDPERLDLIYALMKSKTNDSPCFTNTKINVILNKKICNLNPKPRAKKKTTPNSSDNLRL